MKYETQSKCSSIKAAAFPNELRLEDTSVVKSYLNPVFCCLNGIKTENMK